MLAGAAYIYRYYFNENAQGSDQHKVAGPRKQQTGTCQRAENRSFSGPGGGHGECAILMVTNCLHASCKPRGHRLGWYAGDIDLVSTMQLYDQT